MPGLGRKREMIREGQDWTQEGTNYTGSGKSKKVQGLMGGGTAKPMMGYSKGGITTPVGTTGDDNDVTNSPIGNRFSRLTGKNKSRPSKRGVKRRRP